MKKCSNCKAETEERSKKCKRCGSLLEQGRNSKIICWVLGAMFIFWGVEELVRAGDILFGVLSLLGGLLILPLVYRNFIGQPKLANPVIVVTVGIFATLAVLTVANALQ